MATFASLAGIQLPTKDLEGQPMIFDSYDMSPILFGTGPDNRKEWFYFTENELSPGAARVGHLKFVFNSRGDNGAMAGSDMPGQQLGWRGDAKYVAVVPAIYDLWADPQERYDLFMNSFTEKTWSATLFNDVTQKLMKTYIEYPPRKLQSQGYGGPLELTKYQQFQWLRDQLKKEGFDIGLPVGN